MREAYLNLYVLIDFFKLKNTLTTDIVRSDLKSFIDLKITQRFLSFFFFLKKEWLFFFN